MHKAAAPPPGKIEAGVRVTWTDPDTGFQHANLLVEFAYPMQGSACVRGTFGRIARAGRRVETIRLVRMADCRLEPQAEAV